MHPKRPWMCFSDKYYRRKVGSLLSSLIRDAAVLLLTSYMYMYVEFEWNWNQLLIWIVVTVMVIDYRHGYANVWMYGSCSTLSCSNLILVLVQAKESEQFQYFAIKWNSGLQSNLFNSCRVPKKMMVDYVCVVQVVIFYTYSSKL